MLFDLLDRKCQTVFASRDKGPFSHCISIDLNLCESEGGALGMNLDSNLMHVDAFITV